MSALFRSPLSPAPSSLPFKPDTLRVSPLPAAGTGLSSAAEDQSTDDTGRSSSAGSVPAYGNLDDRGLPVPRVQTTARPESNSGDLSSSRQADRSTREVGRSELALLPPRDSDNAEQTTAASKLASAGPDASPLLSRFAQPRSALRLAQNPASTNDATLPDTPVRGSTSASQGNTVGAGSSANAVAKDESGTPGAANAGVPVKLPDGTVPRGFKDLPTILSPVPDLSPVAEAGKKAGIRFREIEEGRGFYGTLDAWKFMYDALRDNLGHGGAFDYQRRKNDQGSFTFLDQFRGVANYNVGLFCQQAGFSLDQTFAMARTYALTHSDIRRLPSAYYLDDFNKYYIQQGWKAGQSGVFGRNADR